MKLKQPLDPKYEKDLNRLVDDIFACATDVFDYTWPELAERSGVSVSSVYKIGWYETRLPRFQTLWKLARAVDMELMLVKRFPKLARKRA